MTIVNNTPDIWQCKIGPDMRALDISSWIVGAIAAIAGTITTAGLAAPIVAGKLAAGIITVFGVPTSALVAITAPFAGMATVITSGVVTGTTGFGIAVAKSLSDHLDDLGYDTIFSGENRRYGKMMLSLWQQCQCVKKTMHGSKVVIDTVYMRPIFSGSTLNSNREHKIQWWIDKDGTHKDIIQGCNQTQHHTLHHVY